MALRTRVNDPYGTMGAPQQSTPRGRRDGADAADAAIWRMTRGLGAADAARRIREIRDEAASGRGGSWPDDAVDGFVDECNRRLGN